jgi:hypothetical protein
MNNLANSIPVAMGQPLSNQYTTVGDSVA